MSNPATTSPWLRRGALLFWLLLALAPYLWHYNDVGFLSEDFTALVYTSDPARACGDLVGAQYDLLQPLFYRPWVSFSLYLEAALFGFSPFLLKLSNVLLFALGLIAFRALLCRLGCDRVRASLAGLLCAWFPFGAGSVLWLVGRVDAHLFGFGMSFLALHARAFAYGELGAALSWRPRAFLASLVCLLLALLTKESAVAWPLILLLIALCQRPFPRLGRLVLQVLPAFLLLGAYVTWRAHVLGTWIGGYASGSSLLDGPSALVDKVAGLLAALGRIFVWGLVGAEGWNEGSMWFAVILGVGILALLIGSLRWRREQKSTAGRLTMLGLLWALAAALPLFQLWNDPAFATNARVYLLAWSGFAVAAVAALSRMPWIIECAGVLMLLLLSLFGLRLGIADHVAASRAVESLRAHVIDARAQHPEHPVVLEEVPSHVGSAYALTFGLRESVRPPFAPFACEIAAWRKLFPAAAPLPTLAPLVAGTYGTRSTTTTLGFAPDVEWIGLNGTPPLLSGEEAFAWFATWQSLQGGPREALLAALPTLELPGFGPRVRLAFLSSLGSAVAELALPPNPRPALSLIELFVEAPILSSGEGALYVPLEILDKGGDRIWIYAESLAADGQPNGPVSDLLELRFTPSFRSMLQPR